jgi:type II secretory pathway pseudopilin PulG
MHLEGQGRTRTVASVVASEAGYAMAALLVGIAIMGIVATMAIPAWRAAAKREKEAELIFRAGQVAHAIEKFRRKVGGGAYPPDLDFLVRQKYLRKKYKDPMTKDGEWRIVTPQELQAGGVGMRPGSSNPLGGSTGNRGAFGSTSSTGFGSPSGFGSRSSEQNPSSPSGPGGLGSSSPGTSSGGLTPGGRTSSFGVDSPGGKTVNQGPVAAVASKSTEKSIKIFKGRDRYDQWIVTIEDVALRQRNGQQQPGQPGSNRPGSGRPGSSSPNNSFGSPSGLGSSTPGTGSPTTPRR